jgi:hypothetical protein
MKIGLYFTFTIDGILIKVDIIWEGKIKIFMDVVDVLVIFFRSFGFLEMHLLSDYFLGVCKIHVIKW